MGIEGEMRKFQNPMDRLQNPTGGRNNVGDKLSRRDGRAQGNKPYLGFRRKMRKDLFR